MFKTIYRIVLKVGYHDVNYDFKKFKQAAKFAKQILKHEAGNDSDSQETITIQAIEVSADE